MEKILGFRQAYFTQIARHFDIPTRREAGIKKKTKKRIWNCNTCKNLESCQTNQPVPLPCEILLPDEDYTITERLTLLPSSGFWE